MDKDKAKEYARAIEDITGVRSPRRSEEIATLIESGKREELDVLELSQYSVWLARSGDFDQAEEIARSIADPSIQKQTLAAIAQAMIERGVLDRAKSVLDLICDKAPNFEWELPNTVRVQLAEAYGKLGNTKLAISILTEVEQSIPPESLTDYERADYLFVLANGWLIVDDRNHAKQLYNEAFDCAQRSFQITRAAGGNGFDEGQLSLAILRRLIKSGMLSEANRLTSLIISKHWREEAKRLIEGPDSV